MSRFFIVAACLALTHSAFAQNPLRPPFLEAVAPEREEINPFEDRIETDRDAFTPTPKTIGLGRLAVESAYSFIDNRRVKETHSFPETLIRYGISENIELRLGWNYEVGGAGNSVSGAGKPLQPRRRRPPEGEEKERREEPEEEPSLERESQLSYGVKIRLTAQSAWMPESSLILLGGTPTSGLENNTDLAATYVFGWTLPNEWRLDMAMRYGTDEEERDHFNLWSPSAVLRIPLDERITVHGEYFGIFSQGRAENFQNHFLSAGASYLITPDLEVGVRGGLGLNDQSSRGFINAGFGWRF